MRRGDWCGIERPEQIRVFFLLGLAGRSQYGERVLSAAQGARGNGCLLRRRPEPYVPQQAPRFACAHKSLTRNSATTLLYDLTRSEAPLFVEAS